MSKIKGCFVMGMVLVCLLSLTTAAHAVKPACGDGICSPGENAAKCPQDCAPASFCGDGTCDGDETRCDCPQDCGSPPASEDACQDRLDNDCDGAVDCADSDCIDSPLCACNYNGTCDSGENCYTCPEDCPSGPGEGSCDACFKGQCDGICNPKKEGPDCADCTFCCGLDTCDESLCGPGCGSSVAECGNGIIDAGEECDDGNLTPGDGCDENCLSEATPSVPSNQFGIGDSIGEGEAADGTIGEAHHDVVWSTGYNAGDGVDSLNERFETNDPVAYYENDESRDATFNHAISGSVMADFEARASDVVSAAADLTPSGSAGMVTILLGNNDVCAESDGAMTDLTTFETQYRKGLNVLAASDITRYAHIHVSGIPAIYWLWDAKRDSWGCRTIWWLGGVCQVLLNNPVDDCESIDSRSDPDTVFPGDGPECIRRKNFHQAIRDDYNPILRDVLQEYIDDGRLPNAEYIDLYDIRFESEHVNNGDCFHPSVTGHALLADEQWLGSKWAPEATTSAP